MGFRIQPKEVDIPEDDPFKNDLLGRQEPAEVLTHMLRSIEGPCVLAVDAPWGAGKTTFLKMLACHLRNQEFPVVEFNAWETDFTNDPFLALSQELTDGVRKCTVGPLDDQLKKVKKATKEILRLAVPSFIRLATAGLVDVGPMMEKEVGQALANLAQKRLSEYLDAKTSLQTFRASLGGLAAEIAASKQGLPLIAVIDELDRCRPSYAVELLETAKHLFSVDHVVFVLAVNRSELAHSIRGVYGADFDATGYLRRFVDVDFRLPEAERPAFVEASLKTVGIEDYLQERATGRSRGDEYNGVRDWLLAFFVAPDLSLRRIAQSIHRLGLVFASLRKDSPPRALAATVALAMRTLDADRYRAFTRGETEDREAVELLRSRGSGLTRGQDELLEAIVIVAALEIRNPDAYAEDLRPSVLLKEYQEATKRTQQTSFDSRDEATARALRITNHVNRICQVEPLSNALGFMEAVRRIELLSPSLVDEDSESSNRGHGN